MRFWKSSKLLCIVAVLGAAGCGGDKSYDAVGGVTQIAEAICERSFACCDAGENAYYLGPYVTEEDCAERLVEEAHLTSTLWSFDAVWLESELAGVAMPNLAILDRLAAEGKVRLDGVAVEACAEHLRAIECNAYELAEAGPVGCQPDEPDEPNPCDPDEWIVGLVGEGGACDVSLAGDGSSEGAHPGFECADGLACVLSIWGDGTCEQPKQVDESCFADSECAEDLYCSQLDGTCQVPRKLDESCEYSPMLGSETYPVDDLLLVECEAGLYCSPFTSTCVAKCDRGAVCTGDGDCDEESGLVCMHSGIQEVGYCEEPTPGGFCLEDLDCLPEELCDTDVLDGAIDYEHGECVPRKSEGATCLVHSDCASGYCEDVNADPLVVELKCGAPLAVGATCTLEEECGHYAYCDDTTGKCAKAQADGASCDLSEDCISDACIAGYCATTPLAANAPCTSDWQCLSGMCNTELDDPVCVGTVLALGQPCASGAMCASQVCYDLASSGTKTCVQGKGIGETCGSGPECDPFTAFCDSVTNTCTRYKETGEACDRSEECRGTCELNEDWNRRMCSDSAAPLAAVCDGA